MNKKKKNIVLISILIVGVFLLFFSCTKRTTSNQTKKATTKILNKVKTKTTKISSTGINNPDNNTITRFKTDKDVQDFIKDYRKLQIECSGDSTDSDWTELSKMMTPEYSDKVGVSLPQARTAPNEKVQDINITSFQHLLSLPYNGVNYDGYIISTTASYFEGTSTDLKVHQYQTIVINKSDNLLVMLDSQQGQTNSTNLTNSTDVNK
ncbi:hypothetical protein [Clostridium akagii]|uniref:hypothetical protein n=1 Tax=Clostridium akagii TaxID=91623 RepID=UPI00047D4B80|nr:hypothetical protein [Clostridium akagii]